MVSNEKKARVIDSIKKLTALGVSEKEIIGNLTDVGINVNEAKGLISEAKGKFKPNEVEQKIDEKNLFDKKTKNLSINDQISGQLNIKEPSKVILDKTKKPVIQKPKKIEDISKNIDLGLKVKESPQKVIESNEKKQESQIGAMIGEKPTLEKEIKEKPKMPKKKFGLFGKKQDKDPIAELQKELNLTNEKEKVDLEPKKEIIVPKEKMIEEKVAEKIAPNVSNNELEQLWKKGIVTAINSKLSEMKKLKEEIDVEINAKVDAAVKKELTQFKVLMESQKNLTISTNKEVLDDKQKEITLIIDAKISELKKQSTQLSEGIKRVGEAKKEQEDSLQQVQTVLSDAKKTKAQLVVEMNSELIKAKSDAQVFIDSSEKHLEELDQRVNKTLELEKNVADGLVKEAEQKIEKMALTKADDLIEKLEVKLNNLEAMEKKIDPERLEEKINLLEEFKKQFLQNMQENLTEINVAIKEINKKNEDADKILQGKSLAIDAKIEELTKFEKSFTEKIGKALEK
ncbi:MAG: hypothetical protein HON47_00540 [Candidatus Diapherotrites archaeon]|jgi:hypothetical protein|uniref:Uncharacterized protein n=1 Tax=Candidatus Iainarchaeum sp. TaxID=3101447 RepID=A0A8T5GED3_9ARCH|nr:hypothetical protein [Candidatus Diapherotrites archaeon]MBT7241700.1 hypothetical protein [Candidatus Diapherotrites archaeon]